MVEKVIVSDHKIKSSNRRVQSEASMLSNQTMELNFVRQKLETFQASVVADVEKRMSVMIDEVMQEIRKHELQAHEFRNFAAPTTQKQQQSTNTWNNRTTSDKSTVGADQTARTSNVSDDKLTHTSGTDAVDGNVGRHSRALPDKVFVARESYLTALLEVDHMKTIYHIFYIILLVFLMNGVCHDYFVEGRVNFGLSTFKSGFRSIHHVLGVWLLQHVFVFALYYAFRGWAAVRTMLHRQPPLQRFWTHSCLIVYISSQLVFGYVASVLCLRLDLPFVSASVLLLESARLLMKMHAYVRTNAARVVAPKLKADADVPTQPPAAARVPPFSCYLYYLFAPTLIYRDSYPRTAHIRWKFALARFLEGVAIAFLYSYIHQRHIKVHFVDYGREELNAATLTVKLFGMIMPSIIILLCGFYLILHSWLNFTSELLRFGDRMFYKDWWTASTYEAYYRNWNVVVHDWLYEYVYKDCYTYIFKGNKLAASLMVFLVSALVHEQVLGFALQLFFPVIFVFFGVIGVLLVFITRKAPKDFGNLFVWFTLIFGNGMMISLYCMEYYAQQNCVPMLKRRWLDYLIPAVWSCYNS